MSGDKAQGIKRARKATPRPRKKLFFITGLTARQAMALIMVRGLQKPGRAGRRTRPQISRLREAVVSAGPRTRSSNPVPSSGESSNFRFLARPLERCHPG